MNTVLFDLDGTLLPMDMKEFTDTYILLLKNRLETAGYDAKKIIAALWVGEKAVVQNDGLITNEECFWKAFENFMTDGNGKMESKVKRKLEKEIIKFYKDDFAVARYVTHPIDTVAECIDILKEKGYQLVVATNPVFPEIAVKRLMYQIRIIFGFLLIRPEPVHSGKNVCIFCARLVNFSRKRCRFPVLMHVSGRPFHSANA